MKNIFSQYKPFFVFLSKFLLFYVVFTFIYKVYLNQYNVTKNEVDFFTEVVAKQTVYLLNLFADTSHTFPHEFESSIKLFYNHKYVARVVEGCNAISVMILFAAFVFSFSTQWKKTSLYIGLGILLIHILNVVRIALLCYALYYYPDYEKILHGSIFPLFIYGVVFLLWILWITKFSGYVKKNQ
ncbi:exosortase family protein XrtF [Flavobacterium sp.]|uniref:exosortase family protein XrtF n=1 Tax=Flavobacterium sp. TaxID=239 RepID=UPI0040484219